MENDGYDFDAIAEYFGVNGEVIKHQFGNQDRIRDAYRPH